MRAKWAWILVYAKELREDARLDVAQYDCIINNGYVEADAATVNVEMIGFICGKKYSYVTDKLNYSSSDYSTISNKNSYIEALHNSYLTNNIYDKGVKASDILPNASKSGYIFGGWYTSSNFEDSKQVNDATVFNTTVNLYPKFVEISGDSSNVTFDYNGGVSDSLYLKYGTKLSSLVLSGYNGAFWSGTNYASNIYISNSASDPKAKFSTRLYISRNEYTGLFTVIELQNSGTASSWPAGAEYVITISGEYKGTYNANFVLSKISVGTTVVIDKTITSISSSSLGNAYFFETELSSDVITETVDSNFVIPTPNKVGYEFIGWYDSYGKKYESASDFAGAGSITVTAEWKYQDRIIGSFETNSWVVVEESINLNAEFVSQANNELLWTSNTPEVASVDKYGAVTGLKEGLAEIVVCDANYPDIKFTFYVTVFNTTPTGILSVLANSNNSSVYTKNNLLIGITIGSDGAYYSDIVGSVSKILFEEYKVYDTYYLSNPSNKSTLTGSGKGGVDFITVHYAADMPYSASAMYNGGKNMASYNKTCNTNGTAASWHYSVGNDGIWASQSEAYGAWHAGASKAMTWTDSGVTTSQVGSDLYTTDVTLGSDGYFYIKGVKTTVKNTTSSTKLNGMGLGVKVVGSKVYLGGHYYNSSYQYISSTGGNNNSIGMETSVREGSDLWLTWQYTAQLCAKLLLKYELPLNRLVGHHFFSGKWCPQPMLENDLEIWYEFVELTRQQMELYDNYGNYTLTMESNSSHVKDNGRISSLPTYTECVTYEVTYSDGTTTKTVTLSTIIPGTIA